MKEINETQESKPILRLTGKDGNAFSILGEARLVARKAGWEKERISKFMEDAMSGDYNHLLQTCMKSFDVS